MLLSIAKERALPISEVRSWRWAKLKEHHTRLLRDRWEAFLMREQEVEVGTARAIHSAMSKKKLKPLPTFEQLKLRSIWEAPKPYDADWSPETKSRWDKYLAANNLIDWFDGGKSATEVMMVPDPDTGEMMAFADVSNIQAGAVRQISKPIETAWELDDD
jgi:hypothetical protein